MTHMCVASLESCDWQTNVAPAFTQLDRLDVEHCHLSLVAHSLMDNAGGCKPSNQKTVSLSIGLPNEQFFSFLGFWHSVMLPSVRRHHVTSV